METQQIIRELDEEIARLREVRVLLAGKDQKTQMGGSAAKPARKPGRLSAAGRHRISAALKRRWAARRKALAAKAAKRS